MKKAFLLSILLSLLVWGHSPVYGFEDTISDLPTEPIKQPRVIYLKWGQKLFCDYVWRDGDTIFVVVHGKKFAIGYAPNEIDMKRSFRGPPKGAVPKQVEGVSVVALYDKSGMANFINQVAELYLSSLAQHQGKLPSDLFNALQRAGRDAFAGTKMRKKVLQVMKRSFDPELAQEVLDWLLSPLGQKITTLESIQFSPETLQDMQAFGRRLQSHPPPQNRRELIRRLDAAVGASEKNAEVALMILVQTASAMEEVMSKEKRRGVKEMRRELDLRRPQIEENARESTEISFIYIYQTLTDKELHRYVSFSESRTGMTYHKMAFEALMAALSDAAEENGKAVAKILGEYMRKKGG